MKLRENCQYALVAPTSMGVRITPEERRPAHTATRFAMQATSAESNVLSVAAALGLPAKVLTNFVQDSPVAALIKADLHRRGIEYEGPELVQDGPWGYRHQFNIADSGFGVRGPRVHNDRAGEVGRELCTDDFDLDRLFGREGVSILHISGLVAALSEKTGALCLALASAARSHGTLVSFDLNYRTSFWKGRKEELRGLFTAIAQQADILEGNEEDFQLSLGLAGPEEGGGDVAQLDAFKAMIGRAQTAYPSASVFATTLRQVESANRHKWGALLMMDGQWHEAPPRSIDVLDRIGGGDGFVGGLLYGIARGWPAEKCLQFGWATGALATTMPEDYAQPADEEQVFSIWKGNARVVR